MQDRPLVTVIMNCFNGERYLREAIDSVYAQSYAHWEILFWDNASVDGSPAIANSYDAKLKYYRGEKTVPLYAARNFALAQAAGDYIAFLDCDDFWFPNKLKVQLDAFERNRNIGLVYTNVDILEFSGNGRRKFNRSQPSGKIFSHLLKNYNINLVTVMIRREVLNSLDRMFDSSMMISGDADLFLRIAHGCEVAYLPETTAVYREHRLNYSTRLIDNMIGENERVLENLDRVHADFFQTYGKEIASFRRRAQLGVFLLLWKSCRNTEARKMISSKIASHPLFPLLYLLSFFPFRSQWVRFYNGLTLLFSGKNVHR